jgi:ubiquinone/menaquinone biosynthesis C-methylase UbiE
MDSLAHPSPDQPDTAAKVKRWLRCPVTHQPLTIVDGGIECSASGFRGIIRDDVAVMIKQTPSFFDDKYQLMMRTDQNEGEWKFCYAQQTALLSSYLKPGMLVLDVGCGPALPYARTEGVSVIGLEPSFHSIKVNSQVDLRVCGSAYAIPMADASVDVVTCFYSIHHMAGASRQETSSSVTQAFREFRRVLKPGGLLFIFEMTPIIIFSAAQAIGWNALKRLLGPKLDMYFFSVQELDGIARSAFPPKTVLEKIFFGTSAFTAFPPVFSLPWLKVPRIVYPLDPKLYKWRMPSA